jgi:perosamine synthetase
MPRIPYTKPSITSLEVQVALDAITNGWGQNCYTYIKLFEDSFKDFVGSKFAHATSSGTGALHLGLAALGLGPGDEVILADTNWIATVSPIVHLGAKPVFVDILEDTWCIDPEKAESAITPRTKAIIATHLYGNLCNIAKLEEISKKHNLYLIEDAAEAIGSYWGNQHAGSFGIFGIFSFHGTKTITTGEGGMLVTNDSELYKEVTVLNNHGRRSNQGKQFWPESLGYKYKLSNVQAAIGYAQMQRIEDLTQRKREIFLQYSNRLKKFTELQLNFELPNTKSGYWMPTVVFAKNSGITREDLLKAFSKEDIDARVFFWPLSSLPMFSSGGGISNYNSHSIASRSINLPSYHEMKNSEIQMVCDVLEEIIINKKCGL